MKSNQLTLAMNTGFALNRYTEPEEWVRIVGEECGVRYAQFTADLLNPDLPQAIRDSQIQRIQKSLLKYDVQITSCFTGAFTRLNHLAHPEIEIQQHWVQWFKKFIDQSIRLGATSIGSHFGIFTAKDNDDSERRSLRRKQNIQNWHLIAEYGKSQGLQFIAWEPMSISREQGETLQACRQLQEDVNLNSPLPFHICLDLDHGDQSSGDARDTDPYAWLETFAKESPQIHLKQSLPNNTGNFPFIEKYNQEGRIRPADVVSRLADLKSEPTEMILELNFRERQPADGNVVAHLKESVRFWRDFIPA